MTELVTNPEYESLCKEIQSLQSELSHALAELDQLQSKTRPYLLALYHEKLGLAALACLREQCRTEWLRRYMEHVQAARNRGMRPLIEHIEAALQKELENYWAELRDTASKIESAQRFLGSLMKPAESREFRQLYLRLVKRLHPDVNPDVGDRERLLWRRVQEAYSAGDIEALRALWQSVETLPPPDEARVADSLAKRRERLLAAIGRALTQLETLERQPPFDLRDKLTDQGWVQGQLAILAERRAEHEVRGRLFNEQLKVLLGDAWHGDAFQYSAG